MEKVGFVLDFDDRLAFVWMEREAGRLSNGKKCVQHKTWPGPREKSIRARGWQKEE